MLRLTAVAAIFAALAAPVAALAQPALTETLTLAETHPDAPPIAERVPAEPLVVDLAAKGRESGRHGGDLHTFIGRSKDVRLMNVWGYARLMAYTPELELQPDILSEVEDEGGRVFTFHLRKGHKWSDGAPFTAEDFRYYFEDILKNTDLTPTPPPFMLVDGELPTFEVVDETTVRYAWRAPNPRFLPSLAQSRPPFIYRPAHYLKQFHEAYGDPAFIEEQRRAVRVRSWAPLHNQKDEMYDAVNPDLPSLQPWVRVGADTDRRFAFVRNPYFHRVTTDGHQLPYIDRVTLTVVDSSLIPTKVQAGEADLQARSLVFGDLPVLKRGEGTRGYTVRLWPEAKASAMAIYLNMTVNDPELRTLFRDVRFRRALSHAVDRNLLNRVLYYGLGKPSGNLVLPDSPLHGAVSGAALAYDIDRANALLDDVGLTERGDGGVRLLPDGRPLELIVETSGENATEIDALELIRDSWAEAGVAMYPRPSQRDVLRNRAFSGDLAVSVWSGYDNGIPSANMPPDERVPMSEIFLAGPAWGAYAASGGSSGTAPDYEPAERLMAAFDRWLTSESEADRADAWTDILTLHAEQVMSIGTIEGVAQPVVVSNRLRNVPDKAIYGWDPGSHFGLHRMDEFFFADGER